MPEITKNVKFENIAREWRCKWSADSDKASLDAAQAQLDEALVDLSSLDGVLSVQRVVCGGCLDFKIITKLPAAAFGAWEKNGFAPEADVLKALTATKGITSVETQTYTIEEVKMNKKDIKKKQEAKEKAEAADGGEKKEPEKVAEDPAKKLKKVIKEGGKRGVEIEGAADMGGLQFFCTSMDEPNGDIDLLLRSMEAMNEKSDPTEEERKGGSGHVGKMIFSAGTDQLAVVAWVPEDKCSVDAWMTQVLALFGGKIAKNESVLGKGLCSGYVTADGNNNIFPLKIREPMILEANNFLRKLGLFPEDKDDSDEMVFGDDDFPQ